MSDNKKQRRLDSFFQAIPKDDLAQAIDSPPEGRVKNPLLRHIFYNPFKKSIVPDSRSSFTVESSTEPKHKVVQNRSGTNHGNFQCHPSIIAL